MILIERLNFMIMKIGIYIKMKLLKIQIIII